MSRKKSIKKSAQDFKGAATSVSQFLATLTPGQLKLHTSWLYNYAIIKVYKDFEKLILDCLIGAINNDSSTVSQTTGINFPKHMTDEVCAFLITGTGYFNFKDRDGLISTLKKFVPPDHYLAVAVKKNDYKDSLEKMSALRIYAAHESNASKTAALKATSQKRIGSAGAWVKVNDRFQKILDDLNNLARNIEQSSPY